MWGDAHAGEEEGRSRSRRKLHNQQIFMGIREKLKIVLKQAISHVQSDEGEAHVMCRMLNTKD